MPVGKTQALLSPFQHILVRISSMKDIWSPCKGQHVLWDSSSVAPIQRQAKCSDLTDLLGLPGWIFLEKKKKKGNKNISAHAVLGSTQWRGSSGTLLVVENKKMAISGQRRPFQPCVLPPDKCNGEEDMSRTRAASLQSTSQHLQAASQLISPSLN